MSPKATRTANIEAEVTTAEIGNPVPEEAIRRRAYEIYLERLNNRTAIWMIGFRLNANCNAGTSTSGRVGKASAAQRERIVLLPEQGRLA
jgi:hypothetical protein